MPALRQPVGRDASPTSPLINEWALFVPGQLHTIQPPSFTRSMSLRIFSSLVLIPIVTLTPRRFQSATTAVRVLRFLGEMITISLMRFEEEGLREGKDEKCGRRVGRGTGI